MSEKSVEFPSQNVFNFGCVTFASNFDNGNLARVKKIELGLPYQYRIWVAVDNEGTSFQSKQNAWFHFSVSGIPKGNTLRIQVANASNHSSLYRQDMRPVYRSKSTNDKWIRIKQSVRYEKTDNVPPQLTFDHHTEASDDVIYFAFTYPYTYGMVQNDLKMIDKLALEINFCDPESIYCCRELVTNSLDGLRIDLITISAVSGVNTKNRKESNLPGLFPIDKLGIKMKGKLEVNTVVSSSAGDTIIDDDYNHACSSHDDDDDENKNNTMKVNDDNSGRPLIFPSKEIVFISARVHPGESPSQHTWKGMLDFLTDSDDVIAKELRKRYVFKIIPMLNPDGVYRGHFRMDQMGENLNRYYNDPNQLKQPSIFAAKTLIEYYAKNQKLCMYLDMHAHASKRGCFIYGNVLETVDDQVQNQLFCKLISMNSPHFEYEACLFDKEHMQRIDPSEMQNGLTAEGSGRVSTYLTHKLIHSYTLECNYNMSRVSNEITACVTDPKGTHVLPVSSYDISPAPYTPSCYAGVGRACLIALLDIRNQNPCSRILTSKYKTLDKVRQSVLEEIKNKREYRDQSTTGRKYKNFQGLNPEFPVQVPRIISNSRIPQKGHNAIRCHASTCDKMIWRSYADGQIHRKSNDDNDSNRSYDEIGFSNNLDKSFDDSDNNNCNDNKYDHNNNHDDNYEDMHKNDKNKDDEDRRKPQMKKSVDRREISSSTYESSYTRNNVAFDSTRRILLTPRMTAAALRAANALKCSRRIDIRHSSSSSSSWPGTRSTTIGVAGCIRAGSVGCAVNMRHHGIDVITSSYTGNHPITIPNNKVKEVEVLSFYDEVCPKIKLGQHDVIHDTNNDKSNRDSNKPVRKISFTKLELPNDVKPSSSILKPTTNKSKKLSSMSKKEIEKNLSIEKKKILSYDKSVSEEDIDEDLNNLIRDSFKINVTAVTVQSPIFTTCKSQKVVLNTKNTVKNLHNVCTHILKKKRLLSGERLLTENFSAHKTTLSKKLILSSNKILRNNPVKIKGNKIDAVILIRNKNIV